MIFTLALGCMLFALLSWGFHFLSGERWQFLAAVPLYKKKNGCWRSVNFTYYGFFIATSQLLALVLTLCLLGSIKVSLFGVGVAILILLLICIPAARFIAMIVEKKRHTFTIGGASFVGIILAPAMVYLCQLLLGKDDPSFYLPVLPTLAAISIGYTMGEGLGRLACLSYGCCYGKPVAEATPFLQKLFSRVHTIFYGENKKVAYESKLSGVPLIPIQEITSIVYCLATVIGVYLFLHKHFTIALLVTIITTQLWRILSETMRADFRGIGKISAYQKMGLVGVLYMITVTFFFPETIVPVPAIQEGLKLVWNPLVILCLQGSWCIFFIFFGKSSITTSTLEFSLVRKNI